MCLKGAVHRKGVARTNRRKRTPQKTGVATDTRNKPVVPFTELVLRDELINYYPVSALVAREATHQPSNRLFRCGDTPARTRRIVALKGRTAARHAEVNTWKPCDKFRNRRWVSEVFCKTTENWARRASSSFCRTGEPARRSFWVSRKDEFS